MSQQFTIQSEIIRDKLNSLLPSQGQGSIGVELTGSTQIIPIVDLTEVAEGSNLREDLQQALSLASATVFDVSNTTTTIVNTTGYWRLTAVSSMGGSPAVRNSIIMTDGTTTKQMWEHILQGTGNMSLNVDYTFFIPAGVSLQIKSDTATATFTGSVRQIADLSGNLINPI